MGYLGFHDRDARHNAEELAHCQEGWEEPTLEQMLDGARQEYARGIREPVIAVTGPSVFAMQQLLARENIVYTKGPWFYGNGNIFEIKGGL